MLKRTKPDELLSVQEFAAAVGLKPATVRQKVWRRQIEYVKIGRSVRFKWSTVQRLIERGTMPALEELNAPRR